MSSTIPTVATYSTYSEWQVNNRSAAAAAAIANETAWRPHALFAETIIDEYVNIVTRAESSQVRKFPTIDEDGNSEIPYKVKLAHIYITTDLILKGDQTAEQSAVKSESWSGTGYSRTLSEESDRDGYALQIPKIAKRLLKEWATGSAKATY